MFQGRAISQLEEETREISAGMFVQFPKGAQHAVLEILKEPLLTLTIDTPCRAEDDLTFVGLSSSNHVNPFREPRLNNSKRGLSLSDLLNREVNLVGHVRNHHAALLGAGIVRRSIGSDGQAQMANWNPFL